MVESIKEKESEIAHYESFGNEWDAQHRLGEDKAKALFGTLKIENDKLKEQLTESMSKHELLRAKYETLESLIENKDSANIMDDEMKDEFENEHFMLDKQNEEKKKGKGKKNKKKKEDGNSGGVVSGIPGVVIGNLKDELSSAKQQIELLNTKYQSPLHAKIEAELEDRFGLSFFKTLEYVFLDADLHDGNVENFLKFFLCVCVCLYSFKCMMLFFCCKV